MHYPDNVSVPHSFDTDLAATNPADAGRCRMTTPFTAPSPVQNLPADSGLEVASIAELITQRLCGLHRVNDHFVRIEATLGNDGYIALDVTRIDCPGEDPTIRVLLHLTATMEPRPGVA